MAKYLKPYCEKGYVDNSAEIEYLKLNNMRHTILGCMLGDFNEQGIYTISPDIVSELILMRKYIVNTMDNIEICLSELKLDKQLTFMVTFEANRATLSLVEKINFEGNYKLNSGSYSNINEYLLDEVETAGEINRNLIYKKWNIGEFGGAVLDVSSMDEQTLAKYFGIVNRYKYLLLANEKLLESEQEIEEIESDYALNILNATLAYPKLHEAVIKNLKNALDEKNGTIRLDKPNFAKTVNEVLDGALEEHISLLDEKQQQEFEVDKHNAQLEHNQKIKEVIEVENQQVEGKLTENEFIEEPSKTKPVLKVERFTNTPLNNIIHTFNEARKVVNSALAAGAVSLLRKDGKETNEVERKEKENNKSERKEKESKKSKLAEQLKKEGIDLNKNVDEKTREQAKEPEKQVEPKTTNPEKTVTNAPKTNAAGKKQEVSWKGNTKPTGIGSTKVTPYKYTPAPASQNKGNSAPTSGGGRHSFIIEPKSDAAQPQKNAEKKDNKSLVGEMAAPKRKGKAASITPKTTPPDYVSLTYVETGLNSTTDLIVPGTSVEAESTRTKPEETLTNDI